MTYNPYTMSNADGETRETNDYYATDPTATELFLKAINRDNIILPKYIWENACGEGHISQVLMDNGYEVYSTDIIDRNFRCFNGIQDFIECKEAPNKNKNKAIITNPPFKLAEKFVEKAMGLLNVGDLCIYLLRIQFLESKSRKELFAKYPPKYVYVNSERIKVEKNGEFDKYNAKTQCFCWFIWEKGYVGETIVRWI